MKFSLHLAVAFAALVVACYAHDIEEVKYDKALVNKALQFQGVPKAVKSACRAQYRLDVQETKDDIKGKRNMVRETVTNNKRALRALKRITKRFEKGEKARKEAQKQGFSKIKLESIEDKYDNRFPTSKEVRAAQRKVKKTKKLLITAMGRLEVALVKLEVEQADRTAYEKCLLSGGGLPSPPPVVP